MHQHEVIWIRNAKGTWVQVRLLHVCSCYTGALLCCCCGRLLASGLLAMPGTDGLVYRHIAT